jgi:NAD(P)-dependent dehydrogenase (short-subunit alcohol dehydrogenase family)
MTAGRRHTDRVAIVTGGANGIGLATARRLASEGAKVVIADLDGKRAEAMAKEIEDSGAEGTWGVACDVSREDQVEDTVARTVERFGSLHVVVNNAGLMIFKPLEQHTEEDWLEILRVDLLGAFFFTKAAFLAMKAKGAIVNVSSIHAVETTPLVTSYAAAKAAILSLTRSAAIEGKAKGIRVNAVLPGAVDTPMLWNNPNVKSGLERLDRNEVGKADDVAAAISFLASDEAAFIDGAVLRVDGGRLGRL